MHQTTNEEGGINKRGTHADLPVPAEWEQVLRGAKPVTGQMIDTHMPGIAAASDAILKELQPRDIEVIWQRWFHEKTLNEIGQQLDLTRERVRQLLWKIARRAKYEEKVQGRIGSLLHELQLPALIHQPTERSELLPEASGGVLLAMMMHLVEMEEPKASLIHARHLRRSEGWKAEDPLPLLLLPTRWPSDKELLEQMNQLGNFCSTSELAAASGINEDQLGWLTLSHPWLRRSADGRHFIAEQIGLSQAVRATARLLDQAGFHEWHFSELVKAAGNLQPRCLQIKPSARASMLSSIEDNRTFFAQASGKGRWKLKERSDGHHDNVEAVQSVLEKAGTPLHASEIYAALKRDTKEETVRAMLVRLDRFEPYGQGVYGLRGHSYAPTSEADTLMAGIFQQAGLPKVSEAALRGMLAERGLDLEALRLRYLGRHSESYISYRQPRDNRWYYSTQREWRRQQFERWSANNEPSGQIDALAIEEGMAELAQRTHPYSKRKYQRLLAHLSKDGPAQSEGAGQEEER